MAQHQVTSGLLALSDFKVISSHAGTVLVGQLAVMAFGITDTIVAGRYSDTSLAALSVASAIYISIFVALMGTLQALLPVWAELHGGGKASKVGASFRQALYLCGLTIAIGILALLSPSAVLRWTDVPPALRDDAERYLAVLALALAPALLFRMYSTLNQSLGKPLLVTGLQLGALVIKIPLSVWFVFGGAGLEPQGVVGCAWATTVVNYSLFAVAVWMLRTHPLYRPYEIWRALEAPRWREIAGFARLGIPGGLGIMVEVTSFTLMALFIARLGVVSSAGHQIASNLAAVMYMVPLSIAIAASARVSFWRGAGDHVKSMAAIRIGFQMVIGTSLVLSTALLHTPMAGAFVHPQPRGDRNGVATAWVGAYLSPVRCPAGALRFYFALLPGHCGTLAGVHRPFVGRGPGRWLPVGLPWLRALGRSRCRFCILGCQHIRTGQCSAGAIGNSSPSRQMGAKAGFSGSTFALARTR